MPQWAKHIDDRRPIFTDGFSYDAGAVQRPGFPVAYALHRDRDMTEEHATNVLRRKQNPHHGRFGLPQRAQPPGIAWQRHSWLFVNWGNPFP